MLINQTNYYKFILAEKSPKWD